MLAPSLTENKAFIPLIKNHTILPSSHFQKKFTPKSTDCRQIQTLKQCF